MRFLQAIIYNRKVFLIVRYNNSHNNGVFIIGIWQTVLQHVLAETGNLQVRHNVRRIAVL